jgi:STE24 endopeptidase
MYNTIFVIIIVVVVFDFVFERVMQWLNSSWRTKPIPPELNGIYDNEKYKKQQEYSKVNTRFGIITTGFSFAVLLIILFTQGFGWLHYKLAYYFTNPMLIGLLFFGIIFIVMDIINLPFSIYDTFVIEERFGFNKTTPKLFLLDKIKGYILTAIIGGVLYAIIYKFYEFSGTQFWIYTWVIISGFTLFITLFYSNLIVPLFNKQKPIHEGELKDAITEFANKVGFEIDEIYEIDGSKRSTRANAYFTGLGSRKRIVLYDTLIKELTIEELVAVLAHEIGHYKKKHTIGNLFLSILQMGVMLFILSLFISKPELSTAMGVSEPIFHIGLIAFGLLYTPISVLTGLFLNMLSRKNEYQADDFAKNNYKSEALVSALKKLASNNLSNLTPHPFYVTVNYSHPTLLQRIKNIQK